MAANIFIKQMELAWNGIQCPMHVLQSNMLHANYLEGGKIESIRKWMEYVLLYKYCICQLIAIL